MTETGDFPFGRPRGDGFGDSSTGSEAFFDTRPDRVVVFFALDFGGGARRKLL